MAMSIQNSDSSSPPSDSLEASFSLLVMSLASSASMALGLAPEPHTGEFHKDLPMAKFNIDLILMLKEKSKGNLTEEENRFISSVLQDLQLKYVQQKNS